MPIKIPDKLPAKSILENENIFVMTERRALAQDIRPLKLLILNLMPTKIVTETQLLRKLSNTPLQIEVDFLRMVSHDAKNVDKSHLDTFYEDFEAVHERDYDGLIVTGAPVETIDFEKVDYWPELCNVMDWAKLHVHCSLFICWGAQAALYHYYGIPKYDLPDKLSGVFEHSIEDTTTRLFRGFDTEFWVPHSRFTEVRAADIAESPHLEILSLSEQAGVFAVKSKDNRSLFITGHPEYDSDTLQLEYDRDLVRGINPAVPQNYFPGDDTLQKPIVRWKAPAQLLYGNWLNYYVYQSTPYNLAELASNPGEYCCGEGI
ncbi:MAG: homoserine O-succinyltransferase [Oscillospiraceae bacterium]|jgi:homoserine O-succinyltransferase|nr:homoserine O-succinyltransferase [Oscillospiraceae bacterium]